MKYKIIYLGALLVVAVSFSPMAQQISLQEAISIGLENNFAIRQAENTEEIATINSDYAYSVFLPTVDISGAQSWDVEDVNQQFIEGPPREINNARSNRFNLRGDLTWTLFDGTRMFLDVKSAKLDAYRSNFEKKAVIERTLGEIITAYFQLAFEQEQFEVLQSAVDLSAERLEIATANYEVGRFSKSEYLAAKVDLNTDKSNVFNQEEVMKQASVSLNILLGQMPSEEIKAIDSIRVNEALELEELIGSLRENNKQLLALMKQDELLEIDNKRISRELSPQLDFNLGYGYSQLNSQAGFLLQNQSLGLNYGLSLTWRVFNRLDRNRRVQTSKIQIENNQLAIEELENQLIGDLASAFVRYENKLALIDLEESNLNVAQENAEIALARYKEGRSNAIEVREFQLNAVQAEIRLLEAIFQAKSAEIQLLASSGTIITTEFD